MKVHELLAQCFREEGVRSMFGLMGDGNMDFLASTLSQGGVDVYDARHEGAALSMADGYARASGEVGVCTVTCGPGVAQLGTSLMVASRHRTPLVVLAGDTPTGLKGVGALQDMDQRAFVEASGGLVHQLRGAGTVAADVQWAFWLARTRRMPVVLNCPMDVQETEARGEQLYQPSRTRIGASPRLVADPAAMEQAADMLANARRPVLVAGVGARAADARGAIDALGDLLGAALATTIQAKGYLDAPWSIGICGTFATVKSEPVLEMADLVVFIGSSVSENVTGGGSLFPRARTLQIDTSPLATIAGRPADLLLVGDARLTVEALTSVLAEAGYSAPGYRDGSFAEQFAMDSLEREMQQVHWELPAGQVDPRLVIRQVDAALPHDCTVVIGAGHFWSFPTVYLQGHRSRQFHFTYDFGTIGQAVPTAFGVAVADPSRPVVVFEGDSSMLMHLQELDTLARYGPHMLVLVMNDGALGAEYHKLRAKGYAQESAVVRTPDFERVAQGFGMTGATVTDPLQVPGIVEAFLSGTGTHVVDVRVSREVVSRYYRKNFFGLPQ